MNNRDKYLNFIKFARDTKEEFISNKEYKCACQCPPTPRCTN